MATLEQALSPFDPDCVMVLTIRDERLPAKKDPYVTKSIFFRHIRFWLRMALGSSALAHISHSSKPAAKCGVKGSGGRLAPGNQGIKSSPLQNAESQGSAGVPPADFLGISVTFTGGTPALPHYATGSIIKTGAGRPRSLHFATGSYISRTHRADHLMLSSERSPCMSFACHLSSPSSLWRWRSEGPRRGSSPPHCRPCRRFRVWAPRPRVARRCWVCPTRSR